MNKYLKAGLLVFTLVVPVLIFLFLKGFSTNHFDVPYFVPQTDPVTQRILVNEGDTVFYQLPDFTINGTDGNSLSSQQLTGKTLVISSLDTPCGDTCQKVKNQLARISMLQDTYPDMLILTLAKADENIALPETAHEESWRVFSLSDSLYNRYVNNVFRLNEKIGDEQTILSHNRLELIDQNGFIRGYYNALDPEEIERLMVEIKILEYNRKQKNSKQ
jgi:protein SCO1